MKIFKKERLQNGRRNIYFMGIRFFSYCKKQNKNTYDYHDIARVIADGIISRDECDDFSYDFLKHWFSNKHILTDYDVKSTWLAFITAAIQRKDTFVATSTLLQYKQRFGLSEIEKYPYICKLSKKLGFTNEKIDKTIIVMERVQKVRKNNRFEKMIKKAKSVAIVGRSPILVGRGLGKEIDSHDIVIRFNMADVSGKYADDFGIKNDVMVINCWNKNNQQTFCLYIAFKDYGTMPMVIDSIYEDDCKNSDFVDFGLKAHCCKESGLINPTSGALIIMWVKKILGNLNKVDMYGFAFQDENMDLGHYDGNHTINDDVHNMRAEVEFLKQFTKKR